MTFSGTRASPFTLPQCCQPHSPSLIASDTSPAKHGEIFLCNNSIILVIFFKATLGTIWVERVSSFGIGYLISIPLHKVNVSVGIKKPVVHINCAWTATVILSFTRLAWMPAKVLLAIWMVDFSLALAGLEIESATEIRQAKKITNTINFANRAQYLGCTKQMHL